MVADTLISKLASHGISAAAEVVHNLDYDLLFNAETSSERTGLDSGQLTTLGAVAINTGEFNFEGGCCAKTTKPSAEDEPDRYGAVRRDALLENVVVDNDGNVDFDDASKTGNTRVSYPIYHIDNIVKPVSKAGHAGKVIFLTADAFAVLPPVARLTAQQSEYYVLSGYTSKLTGTERGVTEPTPTFSACFGAAFFSLHPTQYAAVLNRRMAASRTRRQRATQNGRAWPHQQAS